MKPSAVSYVATVALLAVVLSLPAALACRCLPVSMHERLASENVFQHHVLATTQVQHEHVAFTRVTEVYNGCLRVGDVVILRSHLSSAACGIRFTPDTDYISALGKGSVNNETRLFELQASLCEMNIDAKSLLNDESVRRLLETRPVRCDGQFIGCATGTALHACFTDPCAAVVEGCGASAAKCVSNYCGGCFAEFFDAEDRPTCFDCEWNKFCGFFHTCNEHNVCVPRALDSPFGDMSLF